MDKVFLDSCQQYDDLGNPIGHTLLTWLQSALDNPDVLHIYYQPVEFFWGWQSGPEEEILAQEISQRQDSNLRFLFGSHPHGQGCYNSDNIINRRWETMIYWPEVFCSAAANNIQKANFTNTDYARLTGQWHGKYTCLMNRPRPHREHTLECLMELDPGLESGLVTWITNDDMYKQYMIEPQWADRREKFQALEKIYDLRPQHQENQGLNFTLLPDNYMNYWFDIVSETSSEYMFFTEKTWRSIACGKPFVILGAQSQNAVLKQWGFLLFEELIDYTLEHQGGPDTWYGDIIKPIINISDETLAELDQMWLSKYKWNYDLWEYMVCSDDNIPTEIRSEIHCGNDFFHNYHDIEGHRKLVRSYRKHIDFDKGIYL